MLLPLEVGPLEAVGLDAEVVAPEVAVVVLDQVLAVLGRVGRDDPWRLGGGGLVGPDEQQSRVRVGNSCVCGRESGTGGSGAERPMLEPHVPE